MLSKASDWSRIQDLFHSLADRSGPEQREELDRISTDEPDIARDVRDMLEADSSGASIFDRSLADVVRGVFGDAAAPPSQLFGPYRIIRLLGEGGMGVVYLGHRDDLDSDAAIKILPDAWLSPARRERFRLEMQTLAALDHPSIARLLDADRLADGTPWFAMEYVEGETLTAWAAKNRLSVRAVLRLFLDVCDAVQHAHERGVIHRDIKPSNVLATTTGGIKLLDFGIATRVGEQKTAARSRTGARLMTPQYAAPEQFRGQAGVTVDVYALGMLLFELIAGALPYQVDERSGDALLEAIRAAYPPNIRRTMAARKGPPGAAIGLNSLSASEWADLDALFAAALAPDPAERYRSVEAFRGDITRLLAQEPLVARKSTLGYRTRKFVRRQWRGVALAAVALGTLGGGLLLHTRSLTAARDVAIAEAARTTRQQQFLVNLFQGGVETPIPVDSLRLATVVRNGIREARGLSNDPTIQAELFNTLATISEQMGGFARADTLYQESIVRSAARNGPEHPETIRARIRRAAVLTRLDQVDSAEAQLLALEPIVRRAPKGHPVSAELDEVLGKLLAERGKIPPAIERLSRAVAARKQMDSTSREYADALRELGNATYYSGNSRGADSLFRLALPINRRLLGPMNPNVGYLLTNLGILASVNGNLAQAETDLREAIAISAAWFGEHHWLTAGARMPLGQTLVRQKRFAEAVPLLRSVLEDYGREPLVGTSSINLARNALGHALAGSGDREGARAQFERSARELRAELGPNHMNTMLAEASLATVLTESGRLDSAIAMLRDLVRRGSAAYGDAHREVATFRIRLGHALLLAKRPRETIELTTGALRVLDSLSAAPTDASRTARDDLAAAYAAVGDSSRAAKYRAPK
ncbi:MAG: tetratricopeptide repeat protein [Gemmatimonadota bacterium]